MSCHVMPCSASLHAKQQCMRHRTSQSKVPLVPDAQLHTAAQPLSRGPSPWLWQALRPPCHHMLPAVPAKGGHELPPRSLQPGSREGSVSPLFLPMTDCKLGRCNPYVPSDMLHSATQQYAMPHHVTRSAAGSEAGITKNAESCWPAASRLECTNNFPLGCLHEPPCNNPDAGEPQIA